MMCPIRENENKEINPIVHGNKLSKDERKSKHEIHKKERMDNLRNKYTDNETKKEWISEIVKNRSEKKKHT